MFGRYLRMLAKAPLWFCVVLALGSTAIWWALLELGNDATGSWDFDEATSLAVMWSSGAVYSVLVLYRYVTEARRLAIVAGAGAFSYWLGVHIAVGPTSWILVNTAVAGVVTAMFVGYVVARLGRLRLSRRLFVSLAGAGAIGGAVIGWSVGEPFVGEDSEVAYVVGHGLWQVLTCVALYFAPQDPPSTSSA